MTPRTTIALMVAMARNRVIGRDNRLPWHLPEDLKFFRRTTWGKPVVMGRRTFESIGRPLPGRTNIIVSGNPGYRAPGCRVAGSLDAALAAAGPAAEVMVIGGAAVFVQALPLARRIYLTLIDADIDGDTWFPPLVPQDWQEIWREDHPADHRHAFPFSFRLLERRETAKKQRHPLPGAAANGQSLHPPRGRE